MKSDSQNIKQSPAKVVTIDKMNRQRRLVQYLTDALKVYDENLKFYEILVENQIIDYEDIDKIQNIQSKDFLKKHLKKEYCIWSCVLNFGSFPHIDTEHFKISKTKDLLENVLSEYKRVLNSIQQEIKELHQHLITTNESIYELSKKRGIMRPDEYYTTQEPYTRKIKLKEIKTFENNAGKVLKLLEKEAPAEYQKLVYSQDNDYDPDTAAIPLLIGKKLSKNASIAFKALTYLIYREYYQGRINSLNSKATVKASDFWRLCNIKSTASGYDYRSKEKIKEAVKELREEILHESKKMFLVTSFVLNFLWEENGQTISFQLDDLFLVYKDQEEMRYYYSDLEGCNRFMDATNNSEKAYWLHHYLEYSLKSCTQTFNFSVILEKAGLAVRYKKEKKNTKQQLFDFLNKMVSEKTLIDGWDLIPSDSDEEGKFKLSNLRTWQKVTHIDEKLKQKNKRSKKK